MTSSRLRLKASTWQATRSAWHAIASATAAVSGSPYLAGASEASTGHETTPDTSSRATPLPAHLQKTRSSHERALLALFKYYHLGYYQHMDAAASGQIRYRDDDTLRPHSLANSISRESRNSKRAL